MYWPIEKGVTVTSTEHLSQTSRIRVGVLAVVAVTAALFLLASQAMAAGAPEFHGGSGVVNMPHATRATVGLALEPGEAGTEWKAEYALAEANGEAPPENSPAWTVANTGQFPTHESEVYIYIGATNPTKSGIAEGSGASTYLRHLTPGTAYYARFIATDKAGRATETIPFKTLPLGKPEVPVRYLGPDAIGPWVQVGASDITADTGFVLESDGSETEYHVEYSLPESGHAPASDSASWQPFTSNGTGKITPVEEYAEVEASVGGLIPETTYYFRIRASNAQGETIQTSTFTTLTARPGAISGVAVRNVTAASVYLTTSVVPQGSKTVWRLESAPSESGPWTPVPGGGGTISQAEAEATPYDVGLAFGARFAGLKASTVYYVRTVAENECAVGCGSSTSRVTSFETSGAPSAVAFAVHGLHGESLRLLGSVSPNSLVTSAEQTLTIEGAPTGGSFVLTFEGQSTGQIAYDASAAAVAKALESLSTIAAGGQTVVTGPVGGPYTVYFGGPNAGKAEPLIEADGLTLAPPGTVSVVSTQQGGEAYDTHYHFEYVSEKSFGGNGWAAAQASAEVDAGSGGSAEYVGYDLPSLTPGETYRYRLVASSTAPGTSLVESAEQALTVPAASGSGETGACPNEAFRTGLSAHLPDCRAYEMLTPVDKEGAQEPFHYGVGVNSDAKVGEDGEHVVLEADAVHWGNAGNSPYLFSRLEGDGWLMSVGSPQPATGPYTGNPELYSSDLTQIAFSSQYDTSFANNSADIEYKLGRVGGPYQTIASIPRPAVGHETSEGWAAGNGELSKLVLATADRTLLGEEATGTKSGHDLYEYTVQGGLRQLNVSGEQAATIGTCGARMADGDQGNNAEGSPYSVSASGSRVFFEAVPGKDCSEAPDLYMRTDGENTVDIGRYKFAAANPEGSEVLLENGSEYFLYDTEAGTIKYLFDLVASARPVVSEDLSDIYLNSGGSLYRYDIPSETLSFITVGASSAPGETSPDGRYYYYEGGAGGLPGSGVMRYDSAENMIECVSCASSFDPEPKQPAFIDGRDGIPNLNGGLPEYKAVSANGDFAFFTTPAALVPQDVNGEIEIANPISELHSGTFDHGGTTSPSSDIYEWRKDGVDGCTQLQGCLALITDGRGGFYNLLLGTADEGRDVFISTRSQLLPQDDDSSGDIYDARIDGGFAPAPPRPVECEGDACSAPPSPPNDATPSSLTFTGAGNLAPEVAAAKNKAAPKKKTKKKVVKRRPKKKKRGKRLSKQAKKSAKGRK
jgi:hypothetical protein